MKRSRLLLSIVLIVLVALGGVAWTIATSTKPQLGLDLQGGFSVVLQAKNIDGKAPPSDNVEKAKDIISQRVDGLGVAEPDITRQGRTVIVQLPGVKNRKKAESLVGCTARLEFRPVMATAPVDQVVVLVDHDDRAEDEHHRVEDHHHRRVRPPLARRRTGRGRGTRPAGAVHDHHGPAHHRGAVDHRHHRTAVHHHDHRPGVRQGRRRPAAARPARAAASPARARAPPWPPPSRVTSPTTTAS